MPTAPTSGFGKLMDYVRRPEYLSANIAEHAIGRSPYEHWYEAAWAGLSGKRRLDYIDLTGNPALGLLLGFAADPLTYLPFGQIPKLVKATRIPKGVSALAKIAGNRWPALGSAARVVKVGLMSGLVDPFYKFKIAAGWDEATDALKALGVSDDIIDAAKMGRRAAELVGDAADANIIKNLDRLATISDTVEESYKIAGKVKSLDIKLKQDLTKFAKWWDEFEKADPKKARAFRELFEKSKPVVIDGRWGFSDEFYKALREIGLTQGEIDDIVARTIKPLVLDEIDMIGLGSESRIAELKRLAETLTGADRQQVLADLSRLEGQVGFYRIGKGVSKTINSEPLRNIPVPWKMPEYTELLDAAMSKLGPEARFLYKRMHRVQSTLAAEVINRQILAADDIMKFLDDTGLERLKHVFTKQGAKGLEKVLETRKVQLEDELLELLESIGMKGKVELDFFTKKDWPEYFKAVRKTILETAPESDKSFLLGKLGQAQKKVEEITAFRKYLGTIDEINAKWKLGGKHGKLFETNLAKILYDDELRTRTAFIYQDYLADVLKNHSDVVKSVDELEGAMTGIAQRLVKGGKFVKISDVQLGDFLVRKEIEGAFKQVLKLTTGADTGFQKFVQNWDRATGVWKYWTLIPFGKFHFRNFVSEIFLNNIAGMSFVDPAYGKATKLLLAVKRGDKKAQKLYRELVELGVIKTGFFKAEAGAVRGLTHGAVSGRAIRTWPVVRTATQGMEQLGEFTEDLPRIAMYFWGQRTGFFGGAKRMAQLGIKGKNENEMLAKLVRRFHPHYGRHTVFESQALKRIMPFYSWTRFNLPLHVEMFVQNPKHYAQLERTRHAVTKLRGGEMPEYYEPNWIKEGYVVGWSKKPGKKTYFVLKGWLPHVDLGDVLSPSGAKDLFVRQLHPVKTVGEIVWSYDLFKKRSIPAYPGEKVTVLGAKVPAKAAQILQPIRVYQEVNKFVWGSTDPVWDRIVYHIFGKVYDIDMEKARAIFKWQTGKAIGELERGVKRAKENGDIKTMRQLEQQKKKLERAVKGL